MRWALVLGCLLALPALALGPFEKNDPLVDEGTDAYEKGQFEHALEKFDQAAKQHPADPRVHYNRALALHKLQRQAEAKESLKRALELDRSNEYANTLHYTLGNIAAQDDQRDEAIREYRKALKADPGDALSRHNLEVLLRKLPPKPNTSDGGTPDGGEKPDGGRPDAGQDGGTSPDAGHDAGTPDGGQKDGGEQDGGLKPDSGMPDAGPDAGPADAGGHDGGGADGGKGDGGQRDAGEGDAGQGDGGQPNDGQRGDAGVDAGAQPESSDGGADVEEASLRDGGMSKKDAEKLLDSFKNNEKNLQLWRFKQKTQKSDSKNRDW